MRKGISVGQMIGLFCLESVTFLNPHNSGGMLKRADFNLRTGKIFQAFHNYNHDKIDMALLVVVVLTIVFSCIGMIFNYRM